MCGVFVVDFVLFIVVVVLMMVKLVLHSEILGP